MERRVLRLVATVGLLVGGCDVGGVAVDLHTDLVAGVEFDEIVLTTPSAVRRTPASAGGDWLTGIRIGPLAASDGPLELTAEARLDGAVVVAERVRTNVRGTVVVPIWLLRSCLDVACPTAEAPTATACRDGHCIPPDCVRGSAECPLGACSSAADCDPATVPCGRADCRETHCVLEAVPGACGSGQYCDFTTGCRSTTLDAGPPPVDAGSSDAPSCGPGCCAADAACHHGELLQWINVARATARMCGTTSMPAVPPVIWNEALESASLGHATYMASSHVLDLTGAGGSTPESRATAAGYAYSFLIPGAFVMRYDETMRDVVDQMLADPRLCAQVMAAMPDEFGAAAADGAPDGIYWAWYLGRR